MANERIIAAEMTEKGYSLMDKASKTVMVSEIKNSDQDNNRLIESSHLCLQIDCKKKYLVDGINGMLAKENISVEGSERATKIDYLESLPKVLILQLKRFFYTSEENTKNNMRVVYQETLSLKLRDGSTQDYNLKIVVVHEGTAGNGHYFTYILDSTKGKWISADDQRVEYVEREEAMDMNYGNENGTDSRVAYLLVYRKKSKSDNSSESENMQAKIRVQLNFQPIPSHIERIETKKDGNCLFSSILRSCRIEGNFVETLRRYMVAGLKENVGNIRTVIKMDNVEETIEKWREDSAPVGLPAVFLLSDILQININILNDESLDLLLRSVKSKHTTTDEIYIYISYNEAQKHYNGIKANIEKSEPINRKIARRLSEIQNLDHEQYFNKYTAHLIKREEKIIDRDMSVNDFHDKFKYSQKQQKSEIKNCVLGSNNQLFKNFWSLRAHITRKGQLIPKDTILNYDSLDRVNIRKSSVSNYIIKVESNELEGGGAPTHIKILAYNSRSLGDPINFHNLNVILDSEKYHIIFINEAWLVNGKSFKLKDIRYEMFATDNRRGGTAIIVHRSLSTFRTFEHI